MFEEKMINVPLEPGTVAVLKVAARANGRAVGREAAWLIRRGLEERRRGIESADAIAKEAAE